VKGRPEERLCRAIKNTCLGDERDAEDQLTKDWDKYVSANKAHCFGMVNTGGPPSYAELLSCLEIMRDAVAIRKSDPLAGENAPLGIPARPTSRRRY
jgi:hypothetical protein